MARFAAPRRPPAWASRQSSAVTPVADQDLSLLSLHREGAAAGLCEDLTVSRDGLAVLRSCQQGSVANIGQESLNSDRRRTLNGWMAKFRPLKLDWRGAGSSPQTLHLELNGRGLAEGSPQALDAIQKFALDLDAELSQNQ